MMGQSFTTKSVSAMFVAVAAAGNPVGPVVVLAYEIAYAASRSSKNTVKAFPTPNPLM